MSPASRGPEAAQDSPPPLPRGAQSRAHTPGDGAAGAQEVPGPPRAPPPRRRGSLERRRAPGGRAGGGRAVTTRRCGAAGPRGKRQAGVSRLLLHSGLSKSVWTAECASLALRGRTGTQRALLSSAGPSCEERPLSRAGGPGRRCTLQCPRRAAEGPPSGLSARISGDSRLHVLRYFMSRAVAAPAA